MHKRRTIGFLTANIHTGASQTMWPGLLDAAERLDANLLCFPGGSLGAQTGFEGQRNAVYHLVNGERVDAVVSWASALGVGLDKEEIKGFHDRFKPLPMISMALPMDEIPTISVNSYEGMRMAVLHLIEVHGIRKIAFVRGPESHLYAQERFRAYEDVLTANGIRFEPKLVTPPMDWGAGVEATQLLVDERGLRPQVDFEAIVAVSDLLALAVMKTLQIKGVKVPGDLAVVGFNDSNEGRLATPALTSVSLDFHEQGFRALEKALELLEGEGVQANVRLPARLVIRQSCGCPSESVEQAAAGPSRGSDLGFQEAIDQVRILLVTDRFGAKGALGQLEKMIDSFAASIDSGSSRGFLVSLEEVLQDCARTTGDIASWQNNLSWLRNAILPLIGLEMRWQIEDFFNQARVLVCEFIQRFQAYQQLTSTRQTEQLREIGQLLITTFDIDGLTDILAEHLPGLGIRSCYLALYEKTEGLSEFSRMVMAYTDGNRIELTEGGRRFLTGKLVPDGIFPTRRFSMVVEPLFFREEQIGFILFEIGSRQGSLYEVLRAQIGSALKGAFLFQQAQQARLAAEKADRIKTRLLANVSHELRTPLNIILNRTKDQLQADQLSGHGLPTGLAQDLRHIQNSAEHQLRVINDLLDLSRAEINELDLYPELIDPRVLLEDVFQSSSLNPNHKIVSWQLNLPEKLPIIKVDPVRLRQILLNLLSNAARFTEQGAIILGAEVMMTHLHFWVEDTGIGISTEDRERIFEPFVTAEHDGGVQGGIGLGLSITRWLVTLHGGKMGLDSQPGQGSVFHVYLPLPNLNERIRDAQEGKERVILFVSELSQPAPEIEGLCERQGVRLLHAQPEDEIESILADVQPMALVWDLHETNTAEWQMMRRLSFHPALAGIPSILYGGTQMGLTSIMVKSVDSQPLLEAIATLYPPKPKGNILIVDDDREAIGLLQKVISEGLKDQRIQTAKNGIIALECMEGELPNLVILDLMMPEMDGFEVLERMRSDPRLHEVPVIVLSNKQLSIEDIKRLEKHSRMILQTKGILTEDELAALLQRQVVGASDLPVQTSAVVKRAIAFLHQNYGVAFGRWEIAEATGVSEDYLSRVFLKEMGISLWDYLNRLRIFQAKELLRFTRSSIQTIARQVGFKDQAYFSRVFRAVTGTSPSDFRQTSSD